MARRNPLRTLVALVVVAAGVAVLWRTSDLGRAAAELESERAAARREGVPSEWADVRRLQPPIPDDENAAALYAPAFESLGHVKEFGNPGLLNALLAGQARTADLDKLRAALRLWNARLDGVKAGTRLKGFTFDKEWERSWDLTFPEFSQARTAGRGLVLRALLAKGPAQAADDLRAAARLRAHLGSEPTLIAALLGNGMEGEIHRAVRRLARRGGPWPAALAPVLDDLGPIPALKRSLASEAVAGMRFEEFLARTDFSAAVGVDSGSTPLVFRLMRVPAVRDASMTRVIQFWRKAWRELPEDPTDFRQAQKALAMPAPSGPSYAVLDVLMPVFDNFAQSNAGSEANRRLTREALALWSGASPARVKDPFGPGPDAAPP